jgi:hypothetical protein
MDDRLEKIDQVRLRAKASYEKAREALENSNWDVVEAVIYLENTPGIKAETFRVKGSELMDRLKELVHQGNVNRIIIAKDGETVANIPLTAGVLVTAVFPILTALGAVIALAVEYEVTIEKQNP